MELLKESFQRRFFGDENFKQFWNLSLIIIIIFFWNTRSNEPIPTLKTFPPQSVSYNFNWRVITRKAKRLKKKVFRDSCIQITLLVRQGWNGLRAVDSDMLSRWPLNVIKRICDRISGLVRKIRMTNGPRYSVRNHSPVPRPFFPPFFWFMLRAGRVRGASLVENLDRPPFILFPFSFFFFFLSLSVNLTWRWLNLPIPRTKFLYSPKLYFFPPFLNSKIPSICHKLQLKLLTHSSKRQF